MRVAIACGNRFFAFDFARELHRRGELAAMVTNYIRAPLEGLPWRRLRWSPRRALHERIVRRFSRRPPVEIDYETNVAFGRWASRQLPRADVLQAWTGYALEPMRVARSRGMVTVACRASAHITTQLDLVAAEAAEFGLTAPLAHPRMVERELREYEEAEYIQVNSTFVLNTFLAQGFSRDRLLLVPNTAVDVAEVRAAERPAASRGPLRVLCLGHVSLRKGTRYVLEAVQRLGRADVTLSIVGGLAAEGQAILDRYAQPGQYQGKVPRSQLREVFAAHDVLVVPSIEDGGPATVAEGMGAGLPVIATVNTIGPDLIEDGHTGYLVPAGDADAIAERIARLADDRARTVEMGAVAARTVARARTWGQTVADMSAQYEAVLATRGSASRRSVVTLGGAA
jgi:glycosyltransferase involved in cell wall biosynthesis